MPEEDPFNFKNSKTPNSSTPPSDRSMDFRTEIGCLGLSRRYATMTTFVEEEEEEPNRSDKKWVTLWKRIVRVKRKVRRMKIFDACNGGGSHDQRRPYDSTTYAQNFDEGPTSWVEEEYDVCRSFSSRFAGPSTVVHLGA